MRTAATTLAAAALLAIGGTAGAALSAGRGRAPVSRAAVAPAPVEVRTQVIHRTVHVVRHIKPKRVKRAAPPAPAPTVAPAPVRPVVAAATPRPVRPLRTRSSATGSTGGGEHEHEHEGGGDD